MKKALFLLVPFAFAVPLLAQQAPPKIPGSADPAAVTAGVYSVDGSHSQINWQVNHFGFNDYFGLFGDIAGKLSIDPANVSAAKVDVEIPIGSLATSSSGLNNHLKAADFFNAEKFPTARFVSTSVTANGTAAVIKGDLTMLGVTKPVELKASFGGVGTNPISKKETIGFQAETTINRSDWGMTRYVPLVGDKVTLRISAAFEKVG